MNGRRRGTTWATSWSTPSGPWEELRGGRLFVTGGVGFVGCSMLESLREVHDEMSLGADAIALTGDPRGCAAADFPEWSAWSCLITGANLTTLTMTYQQWRGARALRSPQRRRTCGFRLRSRWAALVRAGVEMAPASKTERFGGRQGPREAGRGLEHPDFIALLSSMRPIRRTRRSLASDRNVASPQSRRDPRTLSWGRQRRRLARGTR